MEADAHVPKGVNGTRQTGTVKALPLCFEVLCPKASTSFSASLQHFVGTPKVGFLQAHQQHGSQQRFTVSCSRQAPTQPNPQGFEHPGTQLRAQLCLTATGALAWIACAGP